MVARERSSAAWLMSPRRTEKPERAQTWAMPLPMVPAPRTAIVWMEDMGRSLAGELQVLRVCDSGSDEGYEKDGDVVGPAASVGCLDQGLAGGVEAGLRDGVCGFAENVGDLVVCELASETVGGEEVDVADLGTVAVNLGVDGGL